MILFRRSFGELSEGSHKNFNLTLALKKINLYALVDEAKKRMLDESSMLNSSNVERN